ncbi:MAG: esterase/lipase family protein [Thermoguttaceae bacterium]
MEPTGGENCAGRCRKGRRCAPPSALLVCLIVSAGLRPATLPAQQTLPWCHAWQSSFLPSGERASLLGPWPTAEIGPDQELTAQLDEAKDELAAGRLQEDSRRQECVDHYYRGALAAWRALECGLNLPAPDSACPSAYDTYQKCLDHLLFAASRFGRLDPRRHLLVEGAAGPRVIPLAHHGFVWQPRDFCQVISASEFRDAKLPSYHAAPGLGVSLVVLRRTVREEQFHPTTVPFAATAVLRPLGCVAGSPLAPGGEAGPDAADAVLEFYDPRHFDRVALGPGAAYLARDLSAPYAYIVEKAPPQYFRGFFTPAETDVQPKLFLFEPYQRGKIPVIFIHGLLSDPTTWVSAANELKAQTDLHEHYQFWYFRYPTGGILMESAAKLREQLVAMRECFDPDGRDAALERIVLVGHSMGGLVARLQVTWSSDILWRHAARQPLEAVRAERATLERLEREFFFDPSPLVSRVVFVGTPHRGAGMARRSLGRLGSSLVQPLGPQDAMYEQLMASNRDIFYEYLWKSAPTTIDLLEPENPLLQALSQMPVRPGVRFHSIIGTGGLSLSGEPGDGVVPVSSAKLEGVCSELFVRAYHTKLHHAPETVAEVARILRQHAQSH